MFRWALAGLAVFSVGMVSGGLVHHHLTVQTPPPARPPEQSAAPTAPAMVAPQENAVKVVSPVELVVAADTPPEQAGGNGFGASARTTLPSAGEVIITPIEPDRPSTVKRTEPVRNTEVKIARVRTTNPNLRNNPIVQRELTRDIQNELYRVGCYSVIATGRWDARTVKASAQFVANRNAVLPADRPDVILLSLLRSYQGGKCGQSQQVARTAPTLVAPSSPAPTMRRSAAVTPRAVGPIAVPVVRRPTRATEKRTAPRRNTASTARASRKKSRSWRSKVHYGTGSDW
ncbi:MAG: hypothetical protein JXQ99_26040 [Hyphomicrobiaceae bacterium]